MSPFGRMAGSTSFDRTSSPGQGSSRGFWRGAATLGFLVALLPGCYSYTVSDPGIAPVGEHVRVAVTRAGGAEIAQVTGRDDAIPLIEGQLVERDAQTLSVRVPVGSPLDIGAVSNLGQVVRVPVGEILSIEEREFSRGKTALLIGGSTAAATLFVIAMMETFGGGTPIDPGDADVSRSPRSILFSIPFGARP